MNHSVTLSTNKPAPRSQFKFLESFLCPGVSRFPIKFVTKPTDKSQTRNVLMSHNRNAIKSQDR